MEWNGKPDKVRRQILESDYRYGGIRTINVKNYVKACKAVWVNKFLNTDDSDWKILFKYFFGKKKKNVKFFCLVILTRKNSQ